MFKRIRDLIVPGLGAVLCAAMLWKTNPGRVAALHASYDALSAPPLAELQPSFVNILTFGHQNLYEDFINIWLLQILLDSEKAHDPEKLMQTIRSVLKHTPRLETLYMLSCFTMYLDYKKPEACQEIILAGLSVFPESWRLPMTQAYVHYFLLKEPAQAASFFQMAASRPHSPPYVKRLVQKLLSENELDPVDLERSLEIIGSHKTSEEFIKVLQSFGKMTKTGSAPEDQPRE